MKLNTTITNQIWCRVRQSAERRLYIAIYNYIPSHTFYRYEVDMDRQLNSEINFKLRRQIEHNVNQNET
jgi:hypothetical protein